MNELNWALILVAVIGFVANTNIIDEAFGRTGQEAKEEK